MEEGSEQDGQKRIGAASVPAGSLMLERETSSEPPSTHALRYAARRAEPVPALIPLTAAQLKWWNRVNVPAGGTGTRSVCFAMRFAGVLDHELLRSCIDRLICRHEALRTQIALIDGVPWQRVEDPSRYELPMLQLEPASANILGAMNMGEVLVTEKIDLRRDPIFAARIMRLSNLEHVLLVAQEHIISDLFSNSILYREISTLYRQGIRGLPLTLPALTLSFPEYALWQQRTLDAWIRQHGEYWVKRLEGVCPLQLPLSPDEPGQVPCYRRKQIGLGGALSAQLRGISRREQTLLPIVMLTVYAAALSRWCDQQDFVIRFVSHGRHSSELQGIVGFLANDLHLRILVSAEDTIAGLLKRIVAELRSAYRHQDIDRVALLVPHSVSAVAFNWSPVAASQAPGGESDAEVKVEPLQWEPPWPGQYFAQFSDRSDGIFAQVYCRSDAATCAAIHQFGDLLRLFADAFVRTPLKRFETIR